MNPSNSLDQLVEKYETSFWSRLTSKATYLSKKAFKGLVFLSFWSLFGYYVNYAVNTPADEYILKKAPQAETRTEYFLKGQKGEWGNKGKIFFDDRDVFEKTKNFFELCKIEEHDLLESGDRKKLAVAIKHKPLTNFLASDSADKMLFGRFSRVQLGLEGVLDEGGSDIYLMSKDGSVFENLTKMPGIKFMERWTNNDGALVFLSGKGEMQFKKLYFKDKSIIDIPDKLQGLKNTLYLYFLGLAGGLSLIALYDFLRRKNKQEPLPSRIASSVIKHYNLSTFVNLAASSASLYYFDQQFENHMNAAIKSESYLVFLGGINYFFYWGVLELNNIKPPYLENSIKFLSILPTLFLKDSESKMKLLKMGQSAIKDPDDLLEGVSYQLIAKKEKSGFKSLRRSFERVIERKQYSGKPSKIYDLAITPLAKCISRFILSFGPWRIENFLHSIKVDLLYDKNYLAAFKRWDHLVSAKKIDGQVKDNFTEINCLYALFLEDFSSRAGKKVEIGDEIEFHRLKTNLEKQLDKKGLFSELLKEKTGRQWQKTIDLVLSNPQVKYESIGGSRAYVLANNEFLGTTLVFKEGHHQEESVSEQKVADDLSQLVKGSDEFAVAKPIKVVPRQDSYFYVSQFAEGKRLEDLTGPAALEAFKKTARYLALIHSKLKSSKDKRDMKAVVGQRLKCEKHRAYCEAITQNWDVVWDNLKSDYVFDKDAHALNWQVAEDSAVIAVDNTDKGYVPQQFDLVKLIERSKHFEANPKDRLKVIKEYLRAYGGKFDANFKISYLNSVISMAINYHVYDPEPQIDRLFTNNAIKAIALLKTKFSHRFNQAELDQYQKISYALEKIQNL